MGPYSERESERERYISYIGVCRDMLEFRDFM